MSISKADLRNEASESVLYGASLHCYLPTIQNAASSEAVPLHADLALGVRGVIAPTLS
jgi:hypothetical protein